MKHNFFKFSKNIGLFGMAMLIGFSMFTSNCGGDDNNPVDDSDTEETDTTATVTDPMVFDSFSPGTGSYGDEITIYGENFDGDVEVTVNDKLQEDIVSVNDDGTELVFTLASNTYSGIVKLYRSGEDTLMSNDELIYEISYDFDDLEEFNTSYGGIDIVVLDDGSYYLSNGYTLLKFSAEHVITKTIIEKDYTSSPSGMFLGDDEILYIADSDGRILTYTDGNEFVDTLVKDVVNLNETFFTNITGDNKGSIYITNNYGYQVVKIEIANPTNIVALADTDSDETNAIAIEGDYLYVTTAEGVIKMHKDTGVFEYIVARDLGYSFFGSDICVHPSGDIFIVEIDSEAGGFYRISSDYNISKENNILCHGIDVDSADQIYIVGSGITHLLTVN